MISISEEDVKLLNGIWWTLEKYDSGMEDKESFYRCQDYLMEILERLEKQL